MIAPPQKLQVLKAEPDGVLLHWEHPGGDAIRFVVRWSRDDKFHPVDETDGTIIDKQLAGTKSGVYQYRDELPVSGTCRYHVRAFREDPWAQSEPSEPVTVTIKGPAAGDV